MKKFKSEKVFQKWIKEDLEDTWGLDAWIYIPPTRSRRGIPDILGFVKGVPIAWEAKLDNAKPDPSREKLQEYVIGRIQRAGVSLAFQRVTPSSYHRYKDMLLHAISTKQRTVLIKSL